ncbi:hypothetical protein LP123_02875 [Moraxella bovis]|uniref:Uncharacterized protein n=1 Tax=Moraxella bovis TaxID=476 RepID=A0AAQ2Q8V5_MORBO|nr:hypothetical protein [Moraxella bovis]AWY19547.1 hypothetical protein DQF64_02835 [Moraxella bovis]OOR87921.1 hypothetical protein B0182_10870 [Moraxella bovis]UYZ75332.1 hypothetical protein LP093_11375 [Moraxella bovis]UYZ78735.1 hypothetical protein LP115_02485 [Moraxella bovis]UYZ81701.1 hypothetical protein LP113_02895 [Moraxella bovis]
MDNVKTVRVIDDVDESLYQSLALLQVLGDLAFSYPVSTKTVQIDVSSLATTLDMIANKIRTAQQRLTDMPR